MGSITGHRAVDKVARIAGGLFLAYIAAMVLADTLGRIGRGTAEQRRADPRAEGARA